MPSLTVEAPAGSHFEFEEVKTKHGKDTLGPRPILVWDTLAGAQACFGEEGLLRTLDGTSPRVSYQSIARRMAIAGKTDDEIAKAQVDFRPGARVVGESTPVSRAARAARGAAEKLGGESGDAIAAFLEKVARGEIDMARVEELVA